MTDYLIGFMYQSCPHSSARIEQGTSKPKVVGSNPTEGVHNMYTESQRKHYQKNKKVYLERSQIARKKREETVRRYKDVPCEDCGERYPSRVMSFHHRDPKTKDKTINQLVRSASMDRVIQEITKCDVLCANCHMLRH